MKEVTVDDVKKVHDGEINGLLLDVRTPQEYEKGHIKGSINIPLDELTNKVTTIFPDKASTIYVYCLSGSRSNIAVSFMEKMGYTHVCSVTSGLLAWRHKQYPLVVE